MWHSCQAFALPMVYGRTSREVTSKLECTRPTYGRLDQPFGSHCLGIGLPCPVHLRRQGRGGAVPSRLIPLECSGDSSGPGYRGLGSTTPYLPGLYTVIFPGERPPVMKTVTVTNMGNSSTPNALWAEVSAGKAVFQSGTREGRS